jgi:PAS domain S-box-containing protein
MSGKDGQGKRALTALLTKYAAFFERGAQPLCILDPSGNCLAANDSWRELLGRPPGQLTGCLADWLADASEGRELLAQLAAAAAGAGWPRRAWGFRCEDGSSRTLSLSGVAERQGRSKFLVGFASPVLAEAEFPYRALVNDLPVVTYTARLDSTSTTMFVSPQVEQLLGYRPEEVVSDPEFWPRQLHPDDQAAVLARLARCRISGGPFECEYRMRTRDGRYVWVEDKASIVRDERSGPSYLQGVVIDVSERKKAQQELAVRLAYEQMLAEVSADAVASADLDGFIDATLRRLGETTGVSRVYLFRLGGGRLRNTHEWTAPGVPAEKDNLQDEDPAATPYWMERMEADEAIAAHVASLPAAERAVLEPQGIISILAVPLFVQGRLGGFVGFDECRSRRIWSPHDIGLLRTVVRHIASAIERKEAEAALRESEARYRAIVEDQTEFITRFVPADWTLTFVNEACCRFFGKEREELIGRSLIPHVAPEDRERLKALLASLSQESPVASIEHRVTVLGGEVRWQQWTNRAVFDERGELSEFQAVGRDITERKRAEEALAESERRYAALVNNALVGVFRTTLEGEFLYANQAMAEISGYERPEEMRGLDVRSFWVEPGERQEFLAELKAKGRVSNFEAGGQDRRGRRATVLISASLRDGLIEGMLMDITERKRAEEALRESERFLSSIFASIQDSVAVLDSELNIVRVNPALERYLSGKPLAGKRGVPLVGQKCYKAYHGRSEPCERCPSLRTLKTGEPAYEVIPCGEAGGWFELHTFPLVDQATGQAKGVVEYGRDVTERKRAEGALAAARREAQRHAEALAHEQRLLEAVFENTQTLLAYLDRDFNFVRVNDAYARSGARSKEELIGRNHFEVYPSEAEEIFRQVRETGQPYEAMARPFTYPDHPEWGETYWDWTLIPIKDGAGQVDGFVFSLVDVTARVRQQRELEEASQLKDEFLSMASHELKTPVTSIKIFSELASRRPEIVQPQLMVTLNRQADQLVRLVNDLLDVSRLQVGRMPVEMRQIDLAQFLHELCERSRAVYEKNQLVCRVSEGPIMVSGDPARLEQVFQNLIDNAAKYSPEGGTIVIEASLEPEGAVTLSVRDEGIGIAPEHLPHVFERFYKPSAQQAVYPGLGVGLYISKQIVERHGGRIWAESQDGGGSAFHVRLPLASKD